MENEVAKVTKIIKIGYPITIITDGTTGNTNVYDCNGNKLGFIKSITIDSDKQYIDISLVPLKSDKTEIETMNIVEKEGE
jgi:hypothetical protein